MRKVSVEKFWDESIAECLIMTAREHKKHKKALKNWACLRKDDQVLAIPPNNETCDEFLAANQKH